MKRFITYLYEYTQGNKTKNVGFLRVDIRENLIRMEVSIKNYIRGVGNGRLLFLIGKESLVGIDVEEVEIQNGLCNKKFSVDKNNLAGRGYVVSDIVGVAICFDKGDYLASCWDDEWTDEIANAAFAIYKDREIKQEEQREEACGEMLDKNVTMQEKSEIQVATMAEKESGYKQEKNITYKKIELNEIRDLPSANWHLSNNRFLLHGVINYGYLFLKKEVDENGEKMWLGVPGYYEKPELFMALLFGFTEFEPVPKMIVDMELNIESQSHNIETNQEPKTGIFGGWFVMLMQ